MFLEFLQAVTGIFVVVYDGQHALKFTLGRAQEVVGPGVHFKLPIVQRFRVVETKDTTIDLEPQIIQLKDDLVYEVGAKAVYQIVDLRKALIEIDDLKVGLKNRLVLAVQRVVRAQDRNSVRDMKRMIAQVRDELLPVEEQWGVLFHEFGFSTFSPTPETLEITQLRNLAEEKLHLYRRFRDEQGLGEEAAVALISGAIIALRGEEPLRPPPPPVAEPAKPAVRADGNPLAGELGAEEARP
ncbi:MAG TPA: SPFH domain-containing protein [Gemmataceae bacterium]|nr:SPFH domain-containing protein [Gemmataceae bacterium]